MKLPLIFYSIVDTRNCLDNLSVAFQYTVHREKLVMSVIKLTKKEKRLKMKEWMIRVTRARILIRLSLCLGSKIKR